jgi:hypothetical protein
VQFLGRIGRKDKSRVQSGRRNSRIDLEGKSQIISKTEDLMKEAARWNREILRFLLGAAVATGSGCLGYLNPVDSPVPEVKHSCCHLPKYERDHVYIFFLNGIDPVNYGNLTGIRDYVQDLGFHKTYYGQLYHVSYFAEEIRGIHQHEPDAHFVLVGLGRGARKIRDLAQTVKAEGIPIDLMVYLDAKLPEGVGIENGPVLGHFHNEQFCSETGQQQDLWLFGNPTCRQTLELLAHQLGQIAAAIPVVETAEPAPMPRMLDEEPTPRPVQRQDPVQRDEWDFLKPEIREITTEKGEVVR